MFMHKNAHWLKPAFPHLSASSKSAPYLFCFKVGSGRISKATSLFSGGEGRLLASPLYLQHWFPKRISFQTFAGKFKFTETANPSSLRKINLKIQGWKLMQMKLMKTVLLTFHGLRILPTILNCIIKLKSPSLFVY